MRFALLTTLLLFAIPLFSEADTVNSQPEVRAMWVARWDITSPEAIHRVVELASKYGYNTLFVQVRGRGDAFYTSHFEPRAQDLDGQPKDFDPLAQIIDEAHKNGIKVHAWMNTLYTWGSSKMPVSPDHIVNSHPDWIMRNVKNEITWTAGDTYEGAYTCPSNPEVKEFIKNVFLDVVKNYDIDGIHFDFVRYPSPEYCYCDGCMKRFADYMKKRISPEEASVVSNYPSRIAYTLAFPSHWDKFRRQQITDLQNSIYRSAKQIKPNVLVSAAVFPEWVDASQYRYQEWKKWLASGTLDFICPMAYSTRTETVEKQIKDAVAAAGKHPVYAGLGSWQFSADSTVEKIQKVRALGAQGIVIFSYGGVTDDGKKEDYLKEVQERAFVPQQGAEQ